MSAYTVSDGESQPAPCTLTGVITAIDAPWSDEYENISIIMEVAGLSDYPFMCYRLKGEGAKDLAVGDTITATGTVKNYKGTIEFDAGCTLDAVVKAAAEETAEEVVEEVVTEEVTEEVVTEETAEEVVEEEAAELAVMTYAEYAAAELDTQVVIEAYVQDTQSWWENKITVYAQDQDGAYFLYEMACSEEDAAKLVPGTKIKATGWKAEWAGEVEITEATFEFVEDGETFIAEPMDATALLGTDDLILHQNKLVSFKGLTVEKITYKNDEPGDDIYVEVSLNGQSYSFCVERYLTDPDTEVYQTVGTLTVGDVVDVEGFLYWYEGVNTHITAIAKVEAE